MCKSGLETFFTPVYERTEIRKGVYAERSLIGRNIRGLHAEQYQGDLTNVKILDHGPVFIKVELIFTLEGTYHSSVVMKMYRHLPKIEFSYRVTGQKIRRFWLILLTHRYFTWGRWNPTQSFCAITKRRIINGRFTAGLWITHGKQTSRWTCPDSVSSVMEWRLWSREPQRKIWKACQIMTRVWLPLFAGNHCSAVLRRCQAMRPWLSGGSMKNSRRWKKTAGSMTIRRKNQTFRCFFVKNENRRKSTALILRCYVT